MPTRAPGRTLLSRGVFKAAVWIAGATCRELSTPTSIGVDMPTVTFSTPSHSDHRCIDKRRPPSVLMSAGHRGDAGMNFNGVLTHDRRPKMAAYFLHSRWAGPRGGGRAGAR